ncbi:MAG TPA: glucose-6-phosphate dehydrogenase assembly protein OpcA [Acidobacteriota bacterium]|nr:glucose-6-phosphate dehydrogenase assembly protein OpcA [Acidobacteriota bacterium]
MNERPVIFNPGTPVAADAEAIEQALAPFWAVAAGAAGVRRKELPFIRACSCNVVAIADTQEEAGMMPPILAKVSEWHPCRSIITYRESDSEGAQHDARPHMHAWISAQCSIPFPGGPQICCEAITLSAQGQAFADLPNTVLSLLMPDLPIFLYWRSFRGENRAMVERLAQFSNLLIVDSHAAKEDRSNRERLLELLDSPPGNMPVRDLNWSRLTAWRDLIAQFFDPPSSRHYAREISEVEIYRAIEAPGKVPTRTLLLTGWLASRLGWRRISAERVGDQWLSRWNSRQGEILVRFSGQPSTSDEAPGISSITLKTRTGATFSVIREVGSSCLKSAASFEGSQLAHSVPLDIMDEGLLLIHELYLTGEDVGFKAALAEALALERSFS